MNMPHLLSQGINDQLTGIHCAKLACAFCMRNHSWRPSDTLHIEPLYCCEHLACAFENSQQSCHTPHTSCFSLKRQNRCNSHLWQRLIFKSVAPSLQEAAWSIFDDEYPARTYFGKSLSTQDISGLETQHALHSNVSSCLEGGAASSRRCTEPSPHHQMQANLKGDSVCFGRLFCITQDW